jgi:hypothetical protein
MLPSSITIAAATAGQSSAGIRSITEPIVLAAL